MTLLAEPATALFWLSATFILFTYLVYPVWIALAARLQPRPVARRDDHEPTLTVVLVARDEQAVLKGRIENLLKQHYPPQRFDVVAVSDGSTDQTPSIIEQMATEDRRVRPVILTEKEGKAAGLNAGMERATGELVVFADARQRFAPDALARLAENFADPQVGSASGALVLTFGERVCGSVGAYWRYETWIRRNESAAGSMLGATGAIYAIRRELWRPLIPGTILDDFLTPMRIVRLGSRAVFDNRAQALDRPAGRTQQEFRRKIRTLAGNFQAFALEPGLLAPWGNPSTWPRVWAHKVFRLLIPYALVGLLVGSIAAGGWFYLAAAVGQVIFYGLAALGWAREWVGGSVRGHLVKLAYTFIVLNLAAVGGLWCWLRGCKAAQLWKRAYPETSA